jgi:hypothetical protein
VISTNLQRRHLNEARRAMIAARIANMRREDTLNRGSRSANLPIGAVSQPDAATMLHVSTRSVTDAKTVLKSGTQALVARVEAGDVSVSVAATRPLAGSRDEAQSRVDARSGCG